jgi:hypothetical protein
LVLHRLHLELRRGGVGSGLGDGGLGGERGGGGLLRDLEVLLQAFVLGGEIGDGPARAIELRVELVEGVAVGGRRLLRSNEPVAFGGDGGEPRVLV